ncbi:LamG-like jellyroll fold domain-containing protein [Streptomyces sp. ISL-36]|uniref:LamG-like jellyroll fold domain-containing protein n=1 Tax=Streptomyces sp. ISL-36 TaxID=2819182 RepID=UPI0027E4B259|nr:LamG-like jellyroll fold domain-containing protein [Streptomyces sp. ISL-36]
MPAPLDSQPASEEAKGKAFWQDDVLPAPTAEQLASKKAVAEGRSVEVASLTSETNRVLANSDGTFTLESSPVAERVRRNGAWTAIDTALVQRADGRLTPKAAQDVVLSGGGDAPLATITRDGKTFELGAPWKLPAPRIAGASAVYESVRPDVDLVVQIRPDGFTHNLVVHTREAATDPALKAIKFPVKTNGLAVKTSRHGAVSLTDSTNRPVFSSSAALMWDSASDAAPAQTSMRLSAAAAPAETQEEPDLPEPGSHTAIAQVTASDQMLEVAPDQAFLTAPDTSYPVVIDPPAATATLTGWTTLWSNAPKTSFWKTSHSLGVGYDAWVDNKKSRSLFQFDTRAVAGKKILDAQFTAYEIWSANCTPKTVNLYQTSAISAATTFDSTVTWKYITNRSVAKGYSANCPDGDVEFNATAAVISTAGAQQATTTLGLKADEADPIAWKQFLSPADPQATTSRKPRLSITYVSKLDDAPKFVKMADPNIACSASSSPALIRDATPRLTATPVSDDGAQASLRPVFDLYDRSDNNKKVTLRPAEWKPSGQPGEVTTAALVSGHSYVFYAMSEYRYTFNGITTIMGGGPAHAGCYFKVDATAPPKPTVSSTVYAPCAGTTCESDPQAGGVGMPGEFLITANATDVRRYDIWLNGQLVESKTFTANSSSYKRDIAPDKRLTNILRVQTFDGAGNPSAATDYFFNVARGSDPVAAWTFDENSGTTAADATGTHALTLNQGTWNDKARLGSGVDDASSTTYATTAGPVLDTTKSFTVAAWVKLEAKQQTTVLTQMGTTVGAFQLYYSSGYDRWIFNRYAADALDTQTTIARAVSQRPPVLGAWTHVMGVYDAQAAKIRLYVNGVANAEASFTTPWPANGAFEVGRWGNPQLWGDVDHVQLWNRALFPSELSPVVNAENPDTGHTRAALLAQWLMDEPEGALAAADSSGRNNTLSLDGGLGFLSTGDNGHANVLLMDETLGAHGTANVPFDANGSFTLVGWTDLSHYPTLEYTEFAHSPTVFSLPGTKSDALRVWYRQEKGQATGTWNFGLFSADSLNAPGNVSTHSLERPSGWVHVTAVYNAPEKSLKFYLSGKRLGAQAGSLVTNGAFQPTGPLNIGRGRRADTGEFGNHLPGLLDDLRVYAGVLSEQEITQLATVEEPPVPIE